MSDFVSGVSDWMLQQGGFMATWAPWDYGSAKPGYTLPAGVNETTLINLWRRGGTDAPDAWKAFWGYGPAATAGNTGAPPTTGALPAGTDATATTAAPGGPGQVLAAADGTLAPTALAGLSPGVIALLALILLLVIFMLVRRWRAQH
jgi:hypothetical protein